MPPKHVRYFQIQEGKYSQYTVSRDDEQQLPDLRHDPREIKPGFVASVSSEEPPMLTIHHDSRAVAMAYFHHGSCKNDIHQFWMEWIKRSKGDAQTTMPADWIEAIDEAPAVVAFTGAACSDDVEDFIRAWGWQRFQS